MRKISALCLAMIALMVLSAGSATARPMSREVVRTDLTGTVLVAGEEHVDCGENVLFTSGTVVTTSRITETRSGVRVLHARETMSNVKGVGETSGDPYIVTLSAPWTQVRVPSADLQTNTRVVRLVLRNLATGDTSHFYVRFHQTIVDGRIVADHHYFSQASC